jgi:ferrous iron transport protein B
MTKTHRNNNEAILSLANNLRWEIGENFHDKLMESIYANATTIAQKSVTTPTAKPIYSLDRTLDRIVTSPVLGFPMMFLVLAVIFWLTIEGANVPSAMLASLLIDNFHPVLKDFSFTIGLPWW